MYLFYDTMVALGIVNHDFPMADQFSLSSNPTPSQKPSSTSSNMIDDSTGRICGATKIDKQVCQCHKRNLTPDCPTALPFTCTSDNNDRMHKLLLGCYGSSAFDTSPHQALPIMAGPPVESHLKDNVTLVTRHKAIPVPIHWQGQMHSELLHNELLGVIIWQTSGMVPSYGGYMEARCITKMNHQPVTAE